MTAADGRDPDLYEDQVPPFAPGIPGNGPDHEDRGIDHGVAADGFVVDDIVEPAELVAATVTEDVLAEAEAPTDPAV